MKNEHEKNIIYIGKKKDIAAYSFLVENPENVMILIHGLGEHVGRYKRFINEFNSEHISVFAIELRGHGNSAGVRGHCAPRREVLNDIDCIYEYAKKIYPDKKFIIYGHSMGGNVVTDYRYRGKYNGEFKAYIMSAPWIKLTRKVPVVENILIKFLAKIYPNFQFSYSGETNSLSKNSNKDKEKSLSHSSITALSIVESYGIANALNNGTYPSTGNGLSVPMLLMHGDADKICDVEGARNLAKNEGAICMYKEWKELPHALHNGEGRNIRREVVDYVISWIKSL